MSAINVEEGIKRVVNNKKLFFRLLNSFKGRELVDQIIDNVQNGDFDTAIKACHSLKGTAANLAMGSLSDISGQIEDLLREEQSPEYLFESLLENISAVEAAIAEICI